MLRRLSCTCSRALPRSTYPSSKAPTSPVRSHSTSSPSSPAPSTPPERPREDPRWPGWTPTIGLELHVQLKGAPKLFSRALNPSPHLFRAVQLISDWRMQRQGLCMMLSRICTLRGSMLLCPVRCLCVFPSLFAFLHLCAVLTSSLPFHNLSLTSPCRLPTRFTSFRRSSTPFPSDSPFSAPFPSPATRSISRRASIANTTSTPTFHPASRLRKNTVRSLLLLLDDESRGDRFCHLYSPTRQGRSSPRPPRTAHIVEQEKEEEFDLCAFFRRRSNRTSPVGAGPFRPFLHSFRLFYSC